MDRASAAQSRPTWPLFIGAGLTLTGVAAGVGFTLSANAKESDRNALLDGLVQSTRRDFPCDPKLTSIPGECAQAADLLDEEQTHRKLAVGAFVFGGVAAAATAAYWLFWPEPSPGGAAVTLVPVAGSNGERGLSLTAKF